MEFGDFLHQRILTLLQLPLVLLHLQQVVSQGSNLRLELMMMIIIITSAHHGSLALIEEEEEVELWEQTYYL